MVESRTPPELSIATGTILVTEEPPKAALVAQRVAIYARISSAIASGKSGTTGGADDQLLRRERLYGIFAPFEKTMRAVKG